MYLSATDEVLEILTDATATTAEPQYNISYNDHTTTGMVLPQSSTFGILTGNIPVTAVAAPAASTNRQIATLSIYNSDSNTRTITIRKNKGGIAYNYIALSLTSGTSLHYSRERGWTTNEGFSTKYNILEFGANTTYIVPSNLKFAWVFCVGAGGGGGSGRRGAAGTNRFGGGGGGGGSVGQYLFTKKQMMPSYDIVVGLGGTGGAAQLANDSNGSAGNNGGFTTFGNVVRGGGGSGGGGGSNSAGGSGGGAASFASGYMSGKSFSWSGTGGGTGTTLSNAAKTSATAGGYLAQLATGGAGGSGIDNTNAANTLSNTGSFMWVNGVLFTGVLTPNNGLSATYYNFFNSNTIKPISFGIGTGASGGNINNVNGGNGGYGCGGGGGSGVLNGTASGKGGNGGNGFCLILEMY